MDIPQDSWSSLAVWIIGGLIVVIGVLCKVIHHLYYQITGLIAETKEVIGITSEQIRTSNTLMVEVKDAMLLCPKKEVKKEEQ